MITLKGIFCFKNAGFALKHLELFFLRDKNILKNSFGAYRKLCRKNEIIKGGNF
jgi:hypothetical protein